MFFDTLVTLVHRVLGLLLDGCDDLTVRVDYLAGFDCDTAPCDMCTLSRGKECTLGGSYDCSETSMVILSVLTY
jgi:hypothetical protein